MDAPIRIAIFPDKAGFFGVAAGNVDDDGRAGEEAALLVNTQHLMRAQPLAAGHAAHVGEDDVDGVNLRMSLEKGFCFGKVRDLMRGRLAGHRGLVRGVQGLRQAGHAAPLDEESRPVPSGVTLLTLNRWAPGYGKRA